MADLGQVIGTLLVSLAHARRMADEQTAAIAEYYRDNALLQGMTIPRIRVPELIAELPLIFEQVEEGTPPQMNEPAKIHAAATAELAAAAKDAGVELPSRAAQQWKPPPLRSISKVAKAEKGIGPGEPSRENVVNEVQQSLVRWLETSEVGAQLHPDARDTLVSRVRKRVSEVAVKDVGKPAAIKVSVLTSEVKDHDPQTVSRVRLVMREEGLEWGEIKSPDGSTITKLTPE